MPFTDSTAFSTPSVGLERFNVYGTVRSLTNNFDEWYPKGKAKVNEHYRSQAGVEPLRQYSTHEIANNPISFHYVSEMESSLLYSLINYKTVHADDSKTPFKSFNASYIMNTWPKTNGEVGHYSAKIRSVSEADIITKYMNQLQVLMRRV